MRAAKSISRSLIVGRGTLVRVYITGAKPYWLRDGLIGTDDPDEDVTHWAAVVRGRLSRVKSLTTTNEQLDLLQALIDAGLNEAGIVDVPPKKR